MIPFCYFTFVCGLLRLRCLVFIHHLSRGHRVDYLVSHSQYLWLESFLLVNLGEFRATRLRIILRNTMVLSMLGYRMKLWSIRAITYRQGLIMIYRLVASMYHAYSLLWTKHTLRIRITLIILLSRYWHSRLLLV